MFGCASVENHELTGARTGATAVSLSQQLGTADNQLSLCQATEAAPFLPLTCFKSVECDDSVNFLDCDCTELPVNRIYKVLAAL
jgi:hypothetical protein